MSDVTLITGPLRSGTSSVTGLLECCGFDLGKNVRILRNPTEHNPRGHFEPDLLYAINSRLLIESGGDGNLHGILNPPPEPALKALASRRERYFRLFLRKFDGEVCKDPLMCLTLPYWESYWPELKRRVFCLRHPLAVARSMEKRYRLPLETGLELWETYTTRFFGADTRCRTYVFDFDAFRESPRTTFAALLTWLQRPMPDTDIDQRLESFFGAEHVHWIIEGNGQDTLPDGIRSLYADLRSRPGGSELTMPGKTPHQTLDIVLVHIDGAMESNSGLAILDPVLKQHGFRSLVVRSSEIDRYLDQADVFGISVMDYGYSVARELTRRLQGKTVIWGGRTATALPELILAENPGVDYVILQEGENRLVDLLRSWKDPEIFDTIDGIAYRDENHEIRVRPAVAFVDMDKLPPAGDLAVCNGTVYIELSRGCYGRCRYCQETSKMRFKSASGTAREIHDWYGRGFTRFYIGNANSLANGPLLQDLVDELESGALPIELCLVGRPEDVLRNHSILEHICQSPTLRLFAIEVGIEADTRHLLDLIGRGTTPELNKKAITALLDLQQKYSPKTMIMANMILFSHYDMTMEDLIANIRFIGDYGCSKDVLAINLGGIAGTPIWQDMKSRGFQCDTRYALRIKEYPFSDDMVNRLYQKISAYVQSVYLPHGLTVTQREFIIKHLVHDKVMEFYNSGDIMAGIVAFIESAEVEKPILPSLVNVLIPSFRKQV